MFILPINPNGLLRSDIKPLNCTILDCWLFEKSLLAYEPFAKALQSRETCVLVNNNLHGKLVSSLEPSIIFD